MQNYFEILGLPPSFALEAKPLEKAYFAAQRATHPDRFIGKPEAERVAAITRSQLVNDAYDTLKNPLTRAQHLLEMQGVFVFDEDNAQPVDSEILMEMMELRERLQDAAAEGAALMPVVEEIKKLAADCQKDLAIAFEAKDYARATRETTRLQYLGRAMEEATMLIYRLKAQA
jgi:molecular chaperone HscB